MIQVAKDKEKYTESASQFCINCDGTKSTGNTYEITDDMDATYNSNGAIECLGPSRLYKGYTLLNEKEFNRTCGENAEWIDHGNYSCLSGPGIIAVKLEYTEGDNLTFECMIEREGYPPTKSFIYYFEGNSILTGVNTPVSFRRLQASDHNKTISCFAVSNLTQNTGEGNETYNIIVQYEPRNILLTCNNDSTLEITFESNPSVLPGDVCFRMEGANGKIYPTNETLIRNGDFQQKILINNMLNFSFETKFEFGWNYTTYISNFNGKRDNLQCEQEQTTNENVIITDSGTTDFLIAAIAGGGGGLLLILTIILGCLLFSGMKKKENVKEEVTNPVYGMTLKGAEKEERNNPLYAGASSSRIEVEEAYAEVKKDRKKNKQGSSKGKENEAYSGKMETMYASVDKKKYGKGNKSGDNEPSTSAGPTGDSTYAVVKKVQKNRKGEKDIDKPSTSSGYDQESTYATVQKKNKRNKDDSDDEDLHGSSKE